MERRVGPPRWVRPGLGMASELVLVVLSLLPAVADAAKKADPEPGGLLSSIKNSVAEGVSKMNWPSVLQTLLLHVDYWILIAVAFIVASRVTQRSADRKLRRVKAAMDFARHRDANYTSVETGMLEWINHLLRHEWRSIVSNMVDKQATETFNQTLKDSNKMSGGVLKGAVLNELTLGVTPPDLKLYVSRYNPGEDYLQFEFDFRWDTVGSHIFINADVNATGGMMSSFIPNAMKSFTNALPSIRVPIHVTDLSIEGKVLLGMRLSNRQPGVAGVDISFDHKPNVSLQIECVGVPVNDIPGVKEFIEQKIGDVFAASYVEPKRFYQDVESSFLKQFPVAGVDGNSIGDGGCLVVDVDSAERLPSTNQKNKTANPYLELTYAGVTRRTVTRTNTISPSWRTRLAFPVPRQRGDEGTTGFGQDETKGESRLLPLRIRVMDWSPLQEPVCIGNATHLVDISKLRKNAVNAKSTRPKDIAGDSKGGALGLQQITIPLRGSRGGLLKLSLGTVVGTSVNDTIPGSINSITPTRLSRQDSTTSTGFDPDAEEYDEYVGTVETETNTPVGDHSPSTPLEMVRNERVSPVKPIPMNNSNGSGSDGGTAAFHLIKLARLQKQKRDDFDRFNSETRELRHELHGSLEQLGMEKDRRRLELRRALVEGATFTCHTKRKPGFEPGTYRFWYVASKKQFVWAKGAKPNQKPKLHQFVPVSLIKECVVGVDEFTLGSDDTSNTMKTRDEAKLQLEKQRKKNKKKGRRFLPKHGPVGLAKKAAGKASALLVSKKIGEHDPSRCFSVQLWKPDLVENNISDTLLGSGAAGLGLQSIDLELPIGGNGRSVQEWCDAITAVANENGGGRFDDDGDDDEQQDVSHHNGGGPARSKSPPLGGRLKQASAASGLAVENGAAPKRVETPPPEDTTTPLRRPVALPENLDGSSDEAPSGAMLTIPIPPEVEEEEGVSG